MDYLECLPYYVHEKIIKTYGFDDCWDLDIKILDNNKGFFELVLNKEIEIPKQLISKEFYHNKNYSIDDCNFEEDSLNFSIKDENYGDDQKKYCFYENENKDDIITIKKKRRFSVDYFRFLQNGTVDIIDPQLSFEKIEGGYKIFWFDYPKISRCLFLIKRKLYYKINDIYKELPVYKIYN